MLRAPFNLRSSEPRLMWRVVDAQIKTVKHGHSSVDKFCNTQESIHNFFGGHVRCTTHGCFSRDYSLAEKGITNSGHLTN